MFACIHSPGGGPRALAYAQEFSPHIEQSGPDTVTFDVNGLERLYGDAARIAAAIARKLTTPYKEGQSALVAHALVRAAPALVPAPGAAPSTRLRVRACASAERREESRRGTHECVRHDCRSDGAPAGIAIAPNPDAAIHAAQGFSGITLIEHGRQLAPLPLRLLAPTPELEFTLERWGIHTFGELAALPEIGLAERLGAEGVRLQTLARGEGERLLRVDETALEFSAALELDYPVELLEPLSFVLARLLGDLCGRLESRALATNELRLRLTLENAPDHERTLRLPVPLRDARTFLKLLQLDLSSHPPAAPVLKIHLDANPLKPRVTQHGLFLPLAPEPEKLEITLARIAALVGEDRVGSAELENTHRPGAFHMRRFRAVRPAQLPQTRAASVAFRAFRPPRPAKIHAPAGCPTLVQAFRIRGKVLSLAGPWRTSGDWWTPRLWARDEWDAELNDGALYRLSQDLATGDWFVEGVYD